MSLSDNKKFGRHVFNDIHASTITLQVSNWGSTRLENAALYLEFLDGGNSGVARNVVLDIKTIDDLITVLDYWRKSVRGELTSD
jgi:hypothetical protein